jgi:hypothetical protein
MKRLLLFAIFLALSTSIFAQKDTNTIRQRTDFADLVIEGQVVKTTPFWNEGHTKIYTSNLIDVYRVFKGKLFGEQVEVVTEGGAVGNKFSNAVGQPKFTPGIEGIFFCKARENCSHLENTLDVHYTLTGNSLVQYHHEHFNPPASDLSRAYRDLPSELWNNIVLSSREPIRRVKPGGIEARMKKAFNFKTDSPDFTDKSIFYAFENVTVTNNFQNIAFDVHVHVSQNGLLFGKSNLTLITSMMCSERI